MAVQLLALELVLGALLIGGIAAYGKSIAERVCLFCAVPLAFFVSFLLAKFGVWNFIGTKIASLVFSIPGILEMVDGSMAVKTGLEAILISVLRPFLMVLVFWLLLLFLRIVVSIAFWKKNRKLRAAARERKKALKAAKAAAKEAKKSGVASTVAMPAKESFGKKMISSAIGAVTCLVFCLLSFLPITFFANMLEPAIERAESPSYENTYVQETVKTVDEEILSHFDGTAYTYVSRYTGIHAILVATSNAISEVSLVGNDGETVSFNATELLQHLLCDGVDAMAVFEYTYSPQVYTIGDLRPIGDVLSDIAQNPALLKIGAELLETIELDNTSEEEESGLTSGFLNILLDSYSANDTEALSKDLTALSALVEFLSEELSECYLEGDALSPAIINLLSNEENSSKLIGILSNMSSYSSAIGVLTEYGMNMLCDFLEISEDKDAYYTHFRNELLTAINDRTVGDYDLDEVAYFINAAVENEIDVSAYKVEDPDRLSTLDVAFYHYERYIARVLTVETVFSNYTLSSGAQWFLSADGTVYYLDEATSGACYWRRADAETDLSESSLLSSVLVARSTEVFAQNNAVEITLETVHSWCDTLETALRVAYPHATSTMIAEAKKVSNAVLTMEGFQVDAVFRSDVLNAVKVDLPSSEGQNEAFGAVLATAGQLFTNLLGEETVSLDVLVENFGLMGRLLDRLHALDMTADVPAVLLCALSKNKSFGEYIADDTVDDLIDNINSGRSTYEELFGTIQGCFGMVGGLIGGQ